MLSGYHIIRHKDKRRLYVFTIICEATSMAFYKPGSILYGGGGVCLCFVHIMCTTVIITLISTISNSTSIKGALTCLHRFDILSSLFIDF